MDKALYLKPSVDGGSVLRAYAAQDGGLIVRDILNRVVVTLRGTYVNECGGAREALDEFYRDPDSALEYWAPAQSV